MNTTPSTETLKAGTGSMASLTQVCKSMQNKGYKENLVPNYDHLSCNSEDIKLYPGDIEIDEIVRFENTSDPDDQSILYAIYSPSKKVKGLYVESYGLYHDELSPGLLQRFKDCRATCVEKNASQLSS